MGRKRTRKRARENNGWSTKNARQDHPDDVPGLPWRLCSPSGCPVKLPTPDPRQPDLPPMTSLLLINPNTSETTTERLRRALQPALPSHVSLVCRTARVGASYIACEASHAVAAYAVLDVWAEQRVSAPKPIDGVLIGCFGDPGLFALRECCACPVTGLAEAAFIEAAQHGPFAVVTGGERWKPMLARLALALGFNERLLSIETVAPTGAEMMARPDLALEHLGRACANAARAGARSVIVGGAGLAGFAQTLQGGFEVPLIDSVQAGLKVLLEKRAQAPIRSEDGFYAHWTQVPPAFAHLNGAAEGIAEGGVGR